MALTWSRRWRGRRPGRPHVRPALEALEDRWLPSQIFKIQDLGTASGSQNAALAIPVPAKGVAAGHSIIVEVATDDATFVAPSVSDGAGNAYSLDAGAARPGTGPEVLIFSAHGVRPLTSGQSITIQFATPRSLVASASEFAGLAAPNPLDRTNTGGGAGSNGPVTASSGFTGPTTQARELLVGAIAGEVGTGANPVAQPASFQPGAGWTALPREDINLGFVDLAIHPEFRIVAATGPYQANAILSAVDASAHLVWSAAIATYRADTATHFGVSPVSAAVVGVPLGVTVTALDAAGNPVPGYTGTVHFSSSDATAGLSANYTFTTADQGHHAFSVVLRTPGSQTLTVADTLGNFFLPPVAGKATVTVLSSDVTALVSIKAGKVKHLPGGRVRQRLTLCNIGGVAIPGSLTLVLDGLPRGVKLRRRTGVTAHAAPLGSPYVLLTLSPDNVLSPGDVLTVFLEFTGKRRPHYVARVLAGSGAV